MGYTVVRGWPADGPGSRPDLLVIDDPCPKHASAWVRRARRFGVPVASIHDAGRGYVESDLVIDGSIATVTPGVRPLESRRVATLLGPQYAVVDPSVLDARQRGRRPEPNRVLIALGGGTHVYALAARLSAAIAARAPEADIHVAAGFYPPRHLPALVGAARWISAPEGLARELTTAAVAVVAGGVTLYEASAIGVPAVAVAVTPAQHITVRGMAAWGYVVDGGTPPFDAVAVHRVAAAVVAVLGGDRLRPQLGREATPAVDARGALRVAVRLRELIAERATPAQGVRHEAAHAA